MSEILLLTVGTVTLFTGLGLFLASMWHRKKDHPSIEGKSFWPPWKHRDQWEGRGYRFYIWGAVLFVIGSILNLISQFA